VAAVNHLLDGGESLTVNLGTGVGTSVLQLVEAYAQASGRPVPYRIAPRRPGDMPPAGQTPPWPTSAWAGVRATAWSGCALTVGAGSRRTRGGLRGRVRALPVLAQGEVEL
jgi:hypothetical protein